MQPAGMHASARSNIDSCSTRVHPRARFRARSIAHGPRGRQPLDKSTDL